MNDKKKPKQVVYESVKIKTEVVNLVRQNKEKSKVSIGGFFELAAIEKLNKNKDA